MKGIVSASGAQSPPVSLAKELFNLLVPGTAKNAAQGSVSFAETFSAQLSKPGSEQNRQVGMENSGEMFKPLPKQPESVSRSNSDQGYKTSEVKEEKDPETAQVSQPSESKSAMEAAASTQGSSMNQEVVRKNDQPVKNTETKADAADKTAFTTASVAMKGLESSLVNGSLTQMMAILLQNQGTTKIKAASGKAAEIKESADNEVKETTGQKAGDAKKKVQQNQVQFTEVLQDQKSEKAVKQKTANRPVDQSARILVDKPVDGEKPQQAAQADKVVQSSVVKKMAVKEKSEDLVKVQEVRSPASIKPAVETIQTGGIGGVKPQVITQMQQVIGSARLAETRDLSPTMQIIRNVEVLVKDGQTSMQMQLYPENLGKIDLKLTQTPNGVVVMITPDQGMTAQLLESQLDDLRKAFENAGIQLSNLVVGQNNPQAQDQGQQRSKNSSTNEVYPDTGLLPDIEEARSYQYDLSISMLDYRV